MFICTFMSQIKGKIMNMSKIYHENVGHTPTFSS